MLSLLMGLCLMLTACLGDNDDTQVTTYGDMAITAFTLGTIPRYTTGSTSEGNDTTIRTTITGSAYPMTIDQLGHRIYNQNPLPVGTDIRHVVCTITAKNGGSVALQSMTSDSLSWFSNTDSIDFSVPRTFRVYAINGEGYRDYTVTVNVSETTGTTFGWKRVATGVVGVPQEQCAGVRLLSVADRLVMMPLTTDSELASAGNTWRVMVSSDGQQWQRLWDCPDAQWQGAVAMGNDLYMKAGDQLMMTGGNAGWDNAPATVATGLPAGQLVGAGTRELFILDDEGRLTRSIDGGLTWTDERLDDDAALLPAGNVASVTWPYAPADNTDYVLMVGNSRQQGDKMSVWRKLSYQGEQGQWVYMPADDSNYYTLPRMDNLSMTCYDGKVLAIGNGLTMYESSDQGISWQASTAYAMPAAFTGSAAAIAADGNGVLWLVSNNGDLWQGKK